MFTLAYSDAAASTDSAAILPEYSIGDPARSPRPEEQIRHLLFGRSSGLQTAIQRLHQLGYAEPNDWSKPMATGRPNEVMAVLTKRISAV